IDFLAPEARTVEHRLLVAQLREVAFERRAREARKADGADEHRRDGQERDRTGATHDELADGARDDRTRLTDPGAQPAAVFDPDEKRGQGRERRDPAQEHAQAADDSELVEAAEIGEHERGVSESGRDRRRPGRLRREADRARKGFMAVDAFTALLEIASE